MPEVEELTRPEVSNSNILEGYLSFLLKDTGLFIPGDSHINPRSHDQEYRRISITDSDVQHLSIDETVDEVISTDLVPVFSTHDLYWYKNNNILSRVEIRNLLYLTLLDFLIIMPNIGHSKLKNTLVDECRIISVNINELKL